MADTAHPTPYPDVNAALRGLQARIAGVLGNNMVGMYVVGSLALGDFDLNSSDIDTIVMTEADIDADAFRELAEMHAQFDASGSPWAGRVEAVYAPRHALRPDVPRTQDYPQVEKGTGLFRAALEDGWVFQCYSLREHGLTVSGADPRTLMPPIAKQAMRPAVAAIAGGWLEQARGDPDWLEWARERQHQVFLVQTLCRMLYSLATGGVVSKPAALRWGLAALDGRWRGLIEAALRWQGEGATVSGAELDETVSFVRYTAEQSRSP